MAQPGPESPPAEALDIVGRNSCPVAPTYRIQQPREVVASTMKKKAPSQLRCGQCPQQTRRVQTALLTKLLHQGPGRAGRGLRAGRAEARKKAKTLCAVVRIPSAIPESEASRSNVSKTHLEGVPWWQNGQDCASNAGGPGSTPRLGTKIPYAVRHGRESVQSLSRV